MALNFFDQFLIPSFMGIPLIIISVLFPVLTPTSKNSRLGLNRLSALMEEIKKMFSKQLMTSVNHQGHKWTALLLTLAILLSLLNVLGLLPHTFTPTTQLSFNMAIATPLWLATVLVGLRNQPTTSLAHLLPEGSPLPLIPILIIIETMSLLIRPVALGVRLTANITAGHLLIQLISTATFIMASTMTATSAITLIILLMLTGLEIAVALIQAYVFVLLLSLYLQENV